MIAIFLFALIFTITSSTLAEAMQISVHLPSGRLILLEVEAADSIENVQAKIQDILDIAPDLQILTFNDVTLEAGRTLSDYDIRRDNVINLTIINRDPPPQSYIPDPVQTDSITSVFPTSSLAATSITIKGSFLRKVTAVDVDTISISIFNHQSDSISFTLPNHAPGEVTIWIYNGAVPIMKTNFTYLQLPPPPPVVIKEVKKSPSLCVRGKFTLVPKGKKCPSGYVSK